MVDAATDLLEALSSGQREAVLWPFPSDEERRRWFFTPTDHGGLALVDLDSTQHRLVLRLVAAGLSEAGYNTTAVIIGQENVLDRLEGFAVDFDRPRGRDPLLYWLAIFGRPADEGVWGWRFGGHHVSLHFTVVDGRVVSTTPCFLGADPAAAPLLGPHLHRPLAGAEDLGRELGRALDPDQGNRAVLSPVPPVDIVGSNRTELTEGDRSLALPHVWRGRFEAELDRSLADMNDATARSLGLEDHHEAALSFSFTPKGLPGSALRPDQRELLRSLLDVYIGRVADDLADEWTGRLDEAAIDELHFLWAGGLEVGDPHYYRIQGGPLLIEYDNAQRGGNHVHTVWRDLDRDFGGDPLADHYVGGTGRHGA
jgi:hypothetical protein